MKAWYPDKEVGDHTSPSDTGKTLELIVAELESARKKYPPMQSAQEGLAIIKGEARDLGEKIFYESAKIEMKREAIQIAAMAVRFIEDVCGEGNNEI